MRIASTTWSSIDPVVVRFVVYFLCVIPSLALGLLLIPLSIRLLVITSKIELLKQRKAIKHTLLDMRMRKVVLALRMLNGLRLSVVGEEEEGEEAGKGKEGESKKKKKEDEGKGKEEESSKKYQLSSEEIELAREIFREVGFVECGALMFNPISARSRR